MNILNKLRFKFRDFYLEFTTSESFVKAFLALCEGLARNVVMLSFMIGMVGCGFAPKTEVTVVSTYGDMVDVPRVTPTDLKPIQWRIQSYESYVLYSLDDANLNILIGNLDELRRYIREQEAVNSYLRGLIDLRREVKGKE